MSDRQAEIMAELADRLARGAMTAEGRAILDRAERIDSLERECCVGPYRDDDA